MLNILHVTSLSVPLRCHVSLLISAQGSGQAGPSLGQQCSSGGFLAPPTTLRTDLTSTSPPILSSSSPPHGTEEPPTPRPNRLQAFNPQTQPHTTHLGSW